MLQTNNAKLNLLASNVSLWGEGKICNRHLHLMTGKEQ